MDSCYLWARTKLGIHDTIFKNTVGLHLNIKIQVFAGLLDTFLCGTYLTKYLD